MFKLFFFVISCAWFVCSEREFNIYETIESIRYHGYPAEAHHVTTSDGYILEMHRIPHGKNQVDSGNRPVVFLMHGLLAGSNCWLVLGPELAPAYNFADAGFDVWMGNARGTKNSRYHISLNPNSTTDMYEFFDFSWEEIAVYDLPAMIDYILESTGEEKLHYVGHSQGGTVFFVLNSMLPEYNEKIQSAHLCAGVGYMEHFPNTAMAVTAMLTDSIYKYSVSKGMVELFPPDSVNEKSHHQAHDCFKVESEKYLCQMIEAGTILGEDVNGDLDFEIAGASTKQAAHFGQNIRDMTFARWSYGNTINQDKYGTKDPPQYDLSQITADVTMHYTVSDKFLDEKDVLAMASVMPNAKVRKVARDSFLHSDFILAPDAKELVTDFVISSLTKESRS